MMTARIIAAGDHQVLREGLCALLSQQPDLDVVLDIKRIESGRTVLEKAKIPFEKLVQDVIQENQPAADQRKIRLDTKGLGESYPIEVDGGKMHRVVGELVSNAIMYAHEGGAVGVSLGRRESQVVLTVRDSGIGMSAEECEKIFERFFCTKASQTMANGRIRSLYCKGTRRDARRHAHR